MMEYEGIFVDADDVFDNFEVCEHDREGVDILYATYTYENWEGDSYVLFAKDGYLYEVHASHCSCYGLEGQWEPERVDDMDVYIDLLLRRDDESVIQVVKKYMKRKT